MNNIIIKLEFKNGSVNLNNPTKANIKYICESVYKDVPRRASILIKNKMCYKNIKLNSIENVLQQVKG